MSGLGVCKNGVSLCHMRNREYIQGRTASLLLLAWVLMACGLGHAAELLMVEQPGCVFCERFNSEIAPAYPKTSEGKLAPLRRVDLNSPWPADLVSVTPATLTPTFILIHEGNEVDRIAGYPGDNHFWFLLGEMLKKL